MRVLVLNAGSSSLKASAIETPETTLSATTIEWGSDASRAANRANAVRRALGALGDNAGADAFQAVGHRVVHGGARFTGPVLVDDAVLDAIEDASALAPLHNVVALDTIRAAREVLPHVPHVAAFDTAFHATLEPAAYRYPVPEAWFTDWGVRRFGFHGLSVQWAARKASELLGTALAEMALVVAHLGSGCSVTAVLGGRSVDTSMGMTPLEGLMMGTRSGSVDPGMLLRLLIEEKLNAEALESALEHESGLRGVSGISGDVRQLLAAAAGGEDRAGLALEMFARHAAAAVASAATALPRLDAVVFTGGIGENAGAIRAAIVARLGPLGLTADDVSSIAGLEAGGALTRPDRPSLAVVAAREDLVIAGQVAAVLG